MSLLANSNAIESGGYPIQRSLRFRSSASAYLSRTIGTTSSRTTWTWSGWIKRGKLSAVQRIFSGINGANDEFIRFTASDTIEFFLTSSAADVITTQVFRDPSAYYHLIVAIDTTQATAANRVKMYVNGSQITAFGTATYPTQNYLMNAINVSGVSNEIGTYRLNLTTEGFDGYLAEVNFIDGQALTPSSFGQTDPVTGVWQPLKYMGTYGTNGFYLPFSDNTSATTLAYDKSGNGNNWTPNNISTTAGVTYDSMTDVPTLTSATAANYCTINPLDSYGANTVSSGNLNISTASTYNLSRSTISVSSGKWYWEVTNFTGTYPFVGVSDASVAVNLSSWDSANGFFYSGQNGQKYTANAGAAYGATFTGSDVIGVALDMDAGTVTFYKNNVSQGAAFSTLSGKTMSATFTSGSAVASASMNFGQRPFSYTPPTGFKALNTFNLPDPTIKKPNQYMDATLYSGTSASQSVTNTGAFQPDLVWVKSRSAATDHKLTDSVRGATKALISDTTGAETTDTNGLTAFNSNGFTVGSDSVYNNGTGPATYVGWQWKKGATPGFDIQTWSGVGAPQTISHSLGVAPKFIIAKARSGATTDWLCYHASLGATNYIYLNLTNATGSSVVAWNNTAPTASNFSVGTYFNTGNFVSYTFAEIAGFSKFGSYTGNGSADGPFVYCGFRPKYIMVKRTNATSSWYVYDSVRNAYNVLGEELYAESSSAAFTRSPAFDLLSNGFKLRCADAGLNANGDTEIFAAFAENPMKYSLAR